MIGLQKCVAISRSVLLYPLDATMQQGPSRSLGRGLCPCESCSRALRPRGALQWLDVRRLETFRALDHLVGDLLAFLEATESFGCDRRVVAEDVGPPVVLRDEPEALRVVEPLHRAVCH